MTSNLTVATSLEPTALLDLVRDLASAPRLWTQHVAFREPHRQWAKILTRPDVDVWLLTWLQDQGTEYHDHGESLAAFTVLRGTLTEDRPDLLHSDLVTRRLSAGDRTTVPPYAVHSVHNDDGPPAVSIHAYSPPLRCMTYFERAPHGLVPTRRELHAEGRRP